MESRSRICLVLLVFVLLAVGRAEGQESTHLPPTNLDLYRRNVQLIVHTLLSQIPIDEDRQLAVKIHGVEHFWIVENAILNSLQERDFTVRTASDESVNSIMFDFTVIELKVRYQRRNRDGFFGKRTIERSVSTVLAGKVYRRSTRELYYAGTVEKSAKDRIAIDDLPRVEHEQVNVTHGTLPSGGFMKKILEPAVVITATAIAIYLFFSVRS
ncbi:MAG: hypothetical protein ACE5H0_07245 [Bacteroidota bacterium]